jgi:hypothetical protein
VRNRLAWVLGGLGLAGAVALRALRVQPSPAPVAEPLPPAENDADERADELRRKLEESRAIVEERETFESGETPVDEAEPAPASSPDDRRKHVHERARASVDRMQRSAPEE